VAAIGALTLIGAGELMPAMSKAHREALGRLAKPPAAVFLDTTAGFETNVEAITAKAVAYYQERLQTELRVASYRHAGRASAAETARAVAEVRAANFIFAGPGSPTYALEHWRGSPVWEAVLARFREGAHLLFASAAAITTGCYSLPVYEIYKAGRDPYWVEGMDLLGQFGLTLAVLPHFDDHSGGEMYDSRFCYMGAARFEALRALLPPEVAILGIDAYTTVTFVPGVSGARVAGQRFATVIAGDERSTWPAGSTIPLDRLRVGPSSERARAPGAAGEEADPRTLEGLEAFVSGLPGLDEAGRLELLARVAAVARAGEDGRSNEPALVELVLELRQALRAARQWELADRARAGLEQCGYRVADTPSGSTWSRA